MNDIVLQIVQLIVVIIFGVCGAYIIPAIKQNVNTSKFDSVVEWIKIAVAAAEQVIEGKDMGEKKKAQVVEFIKIKINQLGVEISDGDLDALIEAAVNALNISQNKQ